MPRERDRRGERESKMNIPFGSVADTIFDNLGFRNRAGLLKELLEFTSP
jgi:hypothetical protein